MIYDRVCRQKLFALDARQQDPRPRYFLRRTFPRLFPSLQSSSPIVRAVASDGTKHPLKTE